HALRELGLTPMSEEEARETIRKMLNSMSKVIKERGANAFGQVMGVAMKELRGRVDGELVSKLVKEELEKFLEKRVSSS
ncbi:MAG: GatB/YqeY domain-containing protein, partial [Thermofilaceae archaeon]